MYLLVCLFTGKVGKQIKLGHRASSACSRVNSDRSGVRQLILAAADLQVDIFGSGVKWPGKVDTSSDDV